MEMKIKSKSTIDVLIQRKLIEDLLRMKHPVGDGAEKSIKIWMDLSI